MRIPNVIVMVGLPARGKTYISKKLCRYLKWIGIKTRGGYFLILNRINFQYSTSESTEGRILRRQTPFTVPMRRSSPLITLKHSEFESRSLSFYVYRCFLSRESARRAMDDVAQFLASGEGHVAIFDATNTTRTRRETIMKFCDSNRLD